MLTCSKLFAEIPFAHRQPNHKGHCSQIHGHNWSIKITFAAKHKDENGFIVDFGGLSCLKDWIAENLDHAMLFNLNDPALHSLAVAAAQAGYMKLYVVADCSCEGLAQHIFGIFSEIITTKFNGRVRIVSVEVFEDAKNSALYRPSLIDSLELDKK